MINGKNSELLAEIRKLETELKRLKKTKRYGLVWEEKPEAFETEAKNALPVLEEVGELALLSDPHKPQNLIIEGDNFHSLAALSYTHKGLVDVIYIDPPYNTGNKDFVYNDHYVDKEDYFRHSKWLSFMEKRLYLARSLMKDDGVIFVSIDENEHHHLRVLMDSIFGYRNYVENFIWIKNSQKNNSKTTGCVHEYVLCYAKNLSSVEAREWKFRIPKPGFNEAIGLYEKMRSAGSSDSDISTALKNLYKSKPQLKGISQYELIDSKGIYRRSDISAPGGNGGKYDVMHPITGLACKTPSRGWRFKRESMDGLLSNDMISFGKNHNSVPRVKLYLETVPDEVVKSVISNSDEGTADAEKLLPKGSFNNPKPVSLIKHLLSFSLPKDGKVLDFFAGSGTTGQAVLQLNKEDGGNRRFILCSNRENTAENPDKNLCRDVCYERVKRVAQGYENAKGEAVEGLGGSVRYFKTAFVAHSKFTDDLRHAFVDRCSDLLRIKEDCFEEVPGHSGDTFRAYSGNGKNLALVYDPSDLSELKNYLEETSGPVTAYVFAIAQEPFAEELAEWSDRLVLEPIPDGILSSYRKVYGL